MSVELFDNISNSKYFWSEMRPQVSPKLEIISYWAETELDIPFLILNISWVLHPTLFCRRNKTILISAFLFFPSFCFSKNSLEKFVLLRQEYWIFWCYSTRLQISVRHHFLTRYIWPTTIIHHSRLPPWLIRDQSWDLQTVDIRNRFVQITVVSCSARLMLI